MEPALHDACVPLAFLLGTWRGRGEGRYPTIEPFAYVEEVSFTHVGKPFIAYSQRTRHADTDLPLHTEAAYLRPTSAHACELVLTQPSGVVEIHTGAIDSTSLRLHTVHVAGSPTAKRVDRVERDIDVDGDVMRYELRMAAVGQPLQFHLAAELRRV